MLVTLVFTLYPYAFQDLDRLYRISHYFEGLGDHGLWGILRQVARSSLAALSTPSLQQLEPLLNVLLFVPLGFGATSSLRKHVRSWFGVFLVVQVFCSSFSLAIEVAQVIVPTRNSTITDVLTNSLGAALGFLGRLVLGILRNEVSVSISARMLLKTFAVSTACILLLGSYFTFETHLWSLRNWDPTYPLVVGNEPTGNRPWRGTVSSLLLTDRMLPESDIDALLRGDVSSSRNLLAWYVLEGDNPYADQAGPLSPLSSRGDTPNATRAAHAVALTPTHWLETEQPVTHASQRIAATSQFTVATTVATADTVQRGPARILSISSSAAERNVTLGQQGTHLVVRLRTPFNGSNGTHVEFIVPHVFRTTAPQTLVASYRPSALTVFVRRSDTTEQYTVNIDPSTKAIWLFSYVFTGPFTVYLTSKTQTH